MTFLWASLATVGATMAAGAAMLRLFPHRLLDVPTERSSHEVPTPQLGGPVLLAGLAVGMVVLGVSDSFVIGAVVAAVLLGLVGLAEDARGVAVSRRFALQIVAAAIAVPFLLDHWIETGVPRLAVAALVLFWILGLTNTFNFMDGINGIAAVQGIVTGATWVAAGALADEPLLRNLGAITLAANLGFLPWNFPTARFFLGDSGAYLMGGWLAGVAVVGVRLDVSLLALLAPLCIFGGDATLTLVRRLRRREVWYEPHRQHAYQRLVDAGWSQRATTLFTGLLAALCGLGGLAALAGPPVGWAVAAAVVLIAFAGYSASPVLAERRLGVWGRLAEDSARSPGAGAIA